jgi:hypothetical protein
MSGREAGKPRRTMTTTPPQTQDRPSATASPLDGHAPPTTTAGRRPGKAITSMVLGIISIPAALIPIAGLILGILAVVFGATARSEIVRHRLDGKAQAMAGIVCGAVGIVLSVGLFVIGMASAS